MKHIDLHIHTTASDGTLTPEDTVWRAKRLGLSAIAVTDHDTASGLARAAGAGRAAGVEVVPGIEISADYLGREGVHILGYFIDPESPALLELLDWVISERDRRNERIASAMRRDGIDVSPGLLREKYGTAVVGRPHFAAHLVEKGLAASVKDAFRRFLSEGGKYYRAREYIPFDRAFSVIQKAGGKAVLAHPLQYGFDEPSLLALIEAARGRGAVGMECLYSSYDAGQSAYLSGLARRFGLKITGGSDFHGAGKPHIEMGSGTGSLAVPYELLEALKDD